MTDLMIGLDFVFCGNKKFVVTLILILGHTEKQNASILTASVSIRMIIKTVMQSIQAFAYCHPNVSYDLNLDTPRKRFCLRHCTPPQM